MYGLFHVAMRDMVRLQINEATWHEIMKRTNLDDQHFLAMKNYDDADTQQLIRATIEVLGVTADRFLEKLGVFFIGDFSTELRKSLTMGKRPRFEDALVNLPIYIGTVSQAFQKFTSSGFEVKELEPYTIRLDYRSARPGMEYFIKGLVIGVAKLYEEPIKIVLSRSEPDQGDSYTSYLISWSGDKG
ncbi:MAG: hypothetical protein PsegKO_25440 [Pseudohongiellaceae bacterium]|jgi:hypothetical protein